MRGSLSLRTPLAAGVIKDINKALDDLEALFEEQHAILKKDIAMARGATRNIKTIPDVREPVLYCTVRLRSLLRCPTPSCAVLCAAHYMYTALCRRDFCGCFGVLCFGSILRALVVCAIFFGNTATPPYILPTQNTIKSAADDDGVVR